jgi:hypothetical protein
LHSRDFFHRGFRTFIAAAPFHFLIKDSLKIGISKLSIVFFTKTYRDLFSNIISPENLFMAGEAFKTDKLMASLHSYLGVFSHADAMRLSEKLKNMLWLL